MANKTCTKCQETKTLDNFYTSNNPKLDGYDYYCRYCRNGAHLHSIRTQNKKCSLEDCNNPHYAKSLCRMHYSRLIRGGTLINKNEVVDDTKSYPRKTGTQVYNKGNRLKRVYGITLEEYNERTSDGCELCGEKSNRSYHVDHNHSCCPGRETCGKCVRGIVCNRCNAAIDKMETGVMRKDYPNYWLIQQYLEIYNGR